MGTVTYTECPDCKVKNFKLNNYFTCCGKKNPDGGGTNAKHFKTGRKRCIVCKAKNPEDTNFCRCCGRKLESSLPDGYMYYLDSKK